MLQVSTKYLTAYHDLYDLSANLVLGWTIFDHVYLFNGTWFIVTDNPSTIPLLRLMTSTGNEIWNDEESIKGRYVDLNPGLFRVD